MRRMIMLMIAVIMNAAIADRTISTGVVQNPSLPSRPEPNRFLKKPQIGTRISRWDRYMP